MTTVAAPLATSCGSSSPVSRNGPKWLVAMLQVQPVVGPLRGVPITPALLTSTSMGPYAAAPRLRGGPTTGPPGRRRAARAGRRDLVADRLARSRRALPWVRPARTTRPPRRASSRAVWWPSPPSVVPVTRIVRPAWSGMSASGQVSVAGQSRGGGEAGDDLVAEVRSPSTVDRAGLGVAAAAGQQDEALAVHAQGGRRVGRGAPRAAGRGRSRRPRRRTARCRPCRGPGWCRPVRRPSCPGRSRGSRRGTPRCAWRAPCPSRPGGRPRGVRPARASRRRAAGCAAAGASPTGRPPKIGVGSAGGVGRRVAEQPGVPGGGGLADLVDDRVRARVPPVHDPDLGVEPHQPGHVRRLADLGGLLGRAGQDALEVRDVAGDGLDVPARPGRSACPTAPRGPTRAGRGSR